MATQSDKSLARAQLLSSVKSGDGIAGEPAGKRIELPMRYLRQQAHLTAPASDYKLAEKALQQACAVAGRLLERYGISSEALGERLGVEPRWVEEVLGSAGAPVVVLDLEDGVPPHLVEAARANAVRLVRECDRTDTLRYVRPAENREPSFVDQLVSLLLDAGEGLAASAYPIDGLVIPKVRQPAEVRRLHSILTSVEAALGLEPNQIRITLQIETAWGVLNLVELALAALGRLSGLVLGTVDLGADVLLPEIRYRHPLCEWARLQLVTVGGAVGVPAIDGMTLDFPIPSPDLDAEGNRRLVLDRMAANFDDALHSIDLGMAGRWVGHPLQLVATLLAFRSAYRPEIVARHLRRVEAFDAAMAADQGAVAGERGELLDIGTDRHLRSLLRRATAWGALEPSRAFELGLLSAAEVEQLGR